MSSAGLGARATPAGGFPLGGDSPQRGRPGWVGAAAEQDGTGEAVGLELERVVQLLHGRAAEGEGAVRALAARGAPAAQLHAADADLRDIVAELDAAPALPGGVRCHAAAPPPRQGHARARLALHAAGRHRAPCGGVGREGGRGGACGAARAGARRARRPRRRGRGRGLGDLCGAEHRVQCGAAGADQPPTGPRGRRTRGTPRRAGVRRAPWRRALRGARERRAAVCRGPPAQSAAPAAHDHRGRPRSIAGATLCCIGPAPLERDGAGATQAAPPRRARPARLSNGPPRRWTAWPPAPMASVGPSRPASAAASAAAQPALALPRASAPRGPGSAHGGRGRRLGDLRGTGGPLQWGGAGRGAAAAAALLRALRSDGAALGRRQLALAACHGRRGRGASRVRARLLCRGRRGRRGSGAPPPPLPPVLTGHVSSLPPVLTGHVSSLPPVLTGHVTRCCREAGSS